MAELTDFWQTPEWQYYEAYVGDPPGARMALLLSCGWKTRVLDLSPPVDELWRGVRRSYHAPINKLRKDGTFAVVEARPNMFLRTCPALHAKVAGRATRRYETWLMQADWIRTRRAVALVAMREAGGTGCSPGLVAAMPVGFSYAVVTGRCAYYFSEVGTEPNVGHALQWEMIKTLRGMDVRFYEIGWQGEAHDEKGRNIEFAKRGWGGEDVDVADYYRARR